MVHEGGARPLDEHVACARRSKKAPVAVQFGKDDLRSRRRRDLMGIRGRLVDLESEPPSIGIASKKCLQLGFVPSGGQLPGQTGDAVQPVVVVLSEAPGVATDLILTPSL